MTEGERELLLLVDRYKRNPSDETEDAILFHYRLAKALVWGEGWGAGWAASRGMEKDKFSKEGGAE